MKDFGQLILHIEEFPARDVFWLELDEHVNITLIREVVTQDEAEECQPSNVMPSTERLDLILGSGDRRVSW